MLHVYLCQKYWIYNYSSSFIFCDSISILVSFSWKSSSKIQFKFKCKQVYTSTQVVNIQWHVNWILQKKIESFQVFAGIMAMLNFIIPIFSWTSIFTDNSTALNNCLGKGYLNFFSTKFQFCSNENIFCWVWFSLTVIVLSDILDVYCIYCCLKDIKKSTEKSKSLLSKQAYTNRLR